LNSAKKRGLPKLLRMVLALFAILVTVIAISYIMCLCCIKTTQYDIALEGIENPVRLVVVADTHGKVFGKDNMPLYKKIRAQEPDVIVLLGDLLPSEFEKADKADVIDLTQKMHGIAQVFFAMGNHERKYSEKYGNGWLNQIRDTGAIVFDEECKDISLNGNTIRFGSTMGHGFLFGRTREEFEASPEYAVLSTLESSPYPAILLAHMPDTIAFEDARRWWHIDLALCGHTHGGVIRIPGKGGLYAPVQGWWPPFDYGEYQLNDRMHMIITSGISGHNHIPRIFNLPEICVVNLIPAE